jgi:hypothetical protein
MIRWAEFIRKFGGNYKLSPGRGCISIYHSLARLLQPCYTMHMPARLSLAIRIVLVVVSMIACAKNPARDSYIVVKHVVDGEKYVIQHGDVEIDAVCRYSNYTVSDKTYDSYCLRAIPVGTNVKMVKGEGDWLFAEWKDNNVEWRMGLNVEKEEVKARK